MNRLYLRFFGRFQATLNEQPLKITAPKQQALLAWLALAPGQAHLRTMLTNLLWPAHDERRASQNMRKTVARLRSLLPDHLDVTRTTLQLAANSDWASDVGSFLELLAAGEPDAAVEQYGGDFLQEVQVDSAEFDDWALLKRDYLRREYAQALTTLTTTALQRRDYASAYRHAWRRTELDTFDEPAHRQVIESLALQNRKQDAIAHYEFLTVLLENELGIAPASATAALYEKVKSGALSTPADADDHRKQQHNLPQQTTTFVGRVHDLETVRKRLFAPDCRLLTLLGMGGMGKTRLALELGRQLVDQFRDGVWFVPLADLSETAQAPAIMQALASAIGVAFPEGIREDAAREQFLLNHLHDWQALFLLDNYEHLIEQVAPLLALLNSSTKTKFVVTSREPLQLRAEQLQAVGGLNDEEAQTLFVTVAQRVSADFTPTPAINDIVQQVAGMPLALELAASWVRQFSCDEIAEQIANDISFLAANRRDLPERQRSMRAVFNYSWRLLSVEQRDLLRLLAIFPSRFSTDAVLKICQANVWLIRELDAHALVQQVADGRWRFHPAIRQFSAEKLTDQRPAIAQRFAEYYLGTLATFDLIEFDSLNDFAQSEHDNLLQAWRIAAQACNNELLQSAEPNLLYYFSRNSQHVEGVQFLTETLHVLEATAQPSTIAQLQCTRAYFLFVLGNYDDGLAATKVAYQIGEQLANAYFCGKAAYIQGELYRRLSDLDQSLAHFELSLRHVRGQNLPEVEAEALMGIANIYRYQRRFDDSITLSFKSYELSQYFGELTLARITTASLGLNYMAAGRYAEALPYYEKALALSRQIGGGSNIALSWLNLAGLYELLNRYDRAEEAAETGLNIASTIQNVHVVALGYQTVAHIRSAKLKFDAARDAQTAALDLYVTTKNRLRQAEIHKAQGLLALRIGAWADARQLLLSAYETFVAVDHVEQTGPTLALAALAAWRLGEQDEALREVELLQELTAAPAVVALRLAVFGRIQHDKAHYTSAAAAFEQATTLLLEKSMPNRAAEERAKWMLALHAQGADVRAQHAKLLEHLNSSHLYGTLDPIAVYAACLEVEFSAELAQQALSQLNRSAATIDNPLDRQAYRSNIPSHRKLLALVSH